MTPEGNAMIGVRTPELDAFSEAMWVLGWAPRGFYFYAFEREWYGPESP